MAVTDADKIVVWERANKLGKWCPYSAHVCQFLEESYKTDNITVRLGDVDEELEKYTVNFKDMVQVSSATGTKSPIRKRLGDRLGVLGRGFSWQFLDDDNIWNSYEVDVNNYIDTAFLEGKNSINLGRKFPGYHYEIIFSKMIQINKHSKRKRKIRRSENPISYPLVTCDKDVTDVIDIMDIEEENLDNGSEVKQVLSPEYLAQEIPGTRELLYQVNAYKRNVEGFEHIHSANAENADDHVCPKHAKYTPVEEEKGNKSQLYVS